MRSRKDILVVGDWTLDEQWVTGRHSIPTSSRTGEHQRYIRNNPTLNTVYVGGLGRVARQFVQGRSAKASYQIYVIGKWKEKDTKELRTLCEQTDDQYLRNEFFINWGYGKSNDIRKYFHLKNMLNPKFGFFSVKEIKSLEKAVCTTRAIRVYEEEGNHIKMLERIDFDIPESHFLLSNKPKLEKEKKKKDLFPKAKTIGFIVIKDLNKGMICNNTIKLLINKYKTNSKIKWCISSKLWKPEWLQLFRTNNIKIHLLCIPQVSANSAIDKEDIDRWVTVEGIITRKGLNLIDNLKNEFNIKKLLVLPQYSYVIGVDGKENVFVQRNPLDEYKGFDLPMASVFFPKLIQSHLIESGKFYKSLIDTLKSTRDWRSKWYNIIANKELKIDKALPLTKWHPSESFLPRRLKSLQKNWEQSFNIYGYCVHDIMGKNPSFKVWMGKTLLNHYICINRKKRKNVKALIRRLEHAKTFKFQRPEVCFIEASPGSGKSFLVDCIAKELEFDLLKFNISQIASIDKIKDYFQKIHNHQASYPQKTILAFFDEINTPINNVAVYSQFLTALEDGYFEKDNQSFRLKPCVWVFVGTKLRLEKKHDESIKISDFESRFTMPIIKLHDKKIDRAIKYIERNYNKLAKGLGLIDSSGEYYRKDIINKLESKIMSKWSINKIEILKEVEDRVIENIYYAVAFIRNIFRSVTKIQYGCFIIFSYISPTVSVRQIRKFIESLESIAFERMTVKTIMDLIAKIEFKSQMEELFGEFGLQAIMQYDFHNDHNHFKFVEIEDSP